MASMAVVATGRCNSPACGRCGEPETLEHLLCASTRLVRECSRDTTPYRRWGLPPAILQNLSSRPAPIYQRSGAWWSSWMRLELQPTDEREALTYPCYRPVPAILTEPRHRL
ncbi:hypothetical protein HPB52_018410 [Rhipicephalus sanguineus]|uniref:Tick transposon n=1 Tax=Rhipicephalus sanguineus TaxID=34632 RepID=A0A9D4Q817_RHISA|nr:hypothetical protein HPB52_018410 [Rhipicephalus sanguineus]